MPEAAQALSAVHLIGESELRDIRLIGINAEVKRVPSEVSVQFTADGAAVSQDHDEIVVRFEHIAEFTNPEGDEVATIRLVHAAHFTYTEDLQLDDASVRDWVFFNVYFMVHPYVRQALQDTCLRLGLPAVVLGYLKRGNIAPATVSLIVSATTFQRPASGDEALPFEPTDAEEPPTRTASE